VAPASFISRAEELGLIDRLGQRVLDTALRDSRRLVAARGRELTMAVNVSVSQLTPAFVLRTRALLAARGVPASSLMIELTESALAESPE
jgi:EAL domain-containing protein (putative c-di-GMP-specific phosphodiesterase class I)